jgi:hypothetical protein
MTLFLFGAVLSLASAITGVQSVYTTNAGTVITHWHGYGGRFLAVLYAVGLVGAFYVLYRRYRIAWKIGFVLLWLSAAQFIFDAWRMLLPQDMGWVGATAATVFVPLVALYWHFWWRRQRAYFFGDSVET